MNDFQGLFSYPPARMAGVAVLSILALFLLVETLDSLKNIGRSGMPATELITVTGEGQITMAPDVARVSFSVFNTATAVASAQAATTEQTNAALEYVTEQGIEDADVRTLSYDISPQYEYPRCTSDYCPGGSPRITGYQVSQTVEVTVRDLSKVGALLSGFGELGVQNVNGPSFALDDPSAGYDAAREEAITKAKAEAKKLAKQLGVSLGDIVNFSESSGGYPYPFAYGLGGGTDFVKEASVAPSIPTGENTYHATVSITYEIR